MQQLISFIKDHFFIAVIVIGLIYTMFFRKSPLEKRPPNRMPDFGSGPMFPQKQRRPAQQGGKPPIERRDPPAASHSPAEGGLPIPAPVERREPLPEYRELPAQPARSAERPAWLPVDAAAMAAVTAPAVSREEADRQAASAAPIAAGPPDPAGSALMRDDLTRAIVWAEILGPPRSRKPFRR